MSKLQPTDAAKYWLLAGAACVLGVVGLARAQNGFGGSSDRDPIVGTWACTVPTSPGSPPILVIKNIHAGGTAVEIDNAVPPSQETITVGNWTHAGGPLGYVLRLRQLAFDAGGKFVGTFQYTNPLTLDYRLSHLSGSFSFTLVDEGGKVLDSGGGSVSCTRI